MQFVPNYCVSYHGEFHNAGCAFEIDREDVEEMSRHGTVTEEAPAVKETSPADPEGLAEKIEDSPVTVGMEGNASPVPTEITAEERGGGSVEVKTEEAAKAASEDHREQVESAAAKNQAEASAPARKPGRPKKTDTTNTE